jgi:signal transduction histidine kinase
MTMPIHPRAAAAPTGAARPVPAETATAPLRWWVALACGAVVAIAMSTQLLFQPFVWRNFEWDEVLQAWLELAGQRLAVALPIAALIALASRARARAALARAALLVVAILIGALAGETTLVLAGSLAAPPGTASVVARAAQWSLLALSIAALYYLWRRGAALREQAQATERRRTRSERELVQAQLQALRSQIEPHFLFNTLATLRRLHQTEPQQGTRLLAHFLDYLASTLPQRQQGRGTLGEEVDLVRAYLGMIEVRMAGRLRVELDVPAALHACEFPALMLATLIENAVKHGIGPAPDGGAITVQARRLSDSQLEIVVADTGVGFSGSSGGSGVGLANIRSRLQTLYGAAGALALAANTPRGVRATMCVPCVSARPT